MKLQLFAIFALTLVTAATVAGTIEFPANLGYRPERWQHSYGNRLKVCPVPNIAPGGGVCTTPDGRDGWIDPDDISPIPGFWLRHVIYQERAGIGQVVLLFFCRNGTKCKGDN